MIRNFKIKKRLHKCIKILDILGYEETLDKLIDITDNHTIDLYYLHFEKYWHS